MTVYPTIALQLQFDVDEIALYRSKIQAAQASPLAIKCAKTTRKIDRLTDNETGR